MIFKKMALSLLFPLVAAVHLGCQSTRQPDPPAQSGQKDEGGDAEAAVPSAGEEGLGPDSAAAADGEVPDMPHANGARGAPSGAEGADCGGMAGWTCSDGLFCQFALQAQCGAADQMGQCRSRPELCTQDYRPVCGCDDKTYPNECGAHAEGVSVASDGPCPGDGDH